MRERKNKSLKIKKKIKFCEKINIFLTKTSKIVRIYAYIIKRLNLVDRLFTLLD